MCVDCAELEIYEFLAVTEVSSESNGYGTEVHTNVDGTHTRDLDSSTQRTVGLLAASRAACARAPCLVTVALRLFTQSAQATTGGEDRGDAPPVIHASTRRDGQRKKSDLWQGWHSSALGVRRRRRHAIPHELKLLEHRIRHAWQGF